MEGVDTSEFTEDVLACLPPTPWQIQPEEIAKRKDLRALRSAATWILYIHGPKDLAKSL